MRCIKLTVYLEILGLFDTMRLNGDHGNGFIREIKTNCDSILMKSRVVGSLEDSWEVFYGIREDGDDHGFNKDVTLNNPTKTGNIEVELYYISSFSNTDYIELRKVLVAVIIAINKLKKNSIM